MPLLRVRSASLDDVATMARLRNESGWTGGAGEDTMRRYLAGEHHPRHALAPRVAFVAEAGRDVVGFAAGHRTTRFGCDGEVQWLLVADSWRGRRVGAALLAALAEWFQELHVARVCVNVAPENAPARRLYARLGAEDLSEYWMVWPQIGTVAERWAGAPPGDPST